MRDLDDNQFQPNILHDIASDRVVSLCVENKAHHENNNVLRMNSHEWTDEQRHRIFNIEETQNIQRGANTS